MKHRLKNIANRPIPIEGTDIIPIPGEIVEANLTDRNKYLIKNKFYDDLGEIIEIKKAKPDEEEPSDEIIEEALHNIDEEQEKFFESVDVKEEVKNKKSKFKRKRKYNNKNKEDD